MSDRLAWLKEVRGGRLCYAVSCPCGWWSGWSSKLGYVATERTAHARVCVGTPTQDADIVQSPSEA